MFQPFDALRSMLSVAEAQEETLRNVVALPSETVSLSDALGRVLTEDIVARRDLPPADNSAMDGYAVRSVEATAGARLQIAGEIAAGTKSAHTLSDGSALRIMTGAPIPSGCDAVVQIEWTESDGASVLLHRGVGPGTNIRRRGEDMRCGEVVLPRGTQLGAGEIGVLAADFRATAHVARRARVAVVATGDELEEVTSAPRDGAIANSNSHAIAAMLREIGAEPTLLGIARDDRDATIALLRRALEFDFVITTGGVSVGAHDHVKQAFEEIGATTLFWRVHMKPGKPVIVARAEDRLLFGLPGNPVSCLVAFALFVAPALRRAAGLQQTRPPMVRARAGERLRAKGDRPSYLRVRVAAVDGQLVATPMRAQGSGVSTSMIGANGLALVQGEQTIERGEEVDVVMLGAIHLF